MAVGAAAEFQMHEFDAVAGLVLRVGFRVQACDGNGGPVVGLLVADERAQGVRRSEEFPCGVGFRGVGQRAIDGPQA